jgi:hypothetical protein
LTPKKKGKARDESAQGENGVCRRCDVLRFLAVVRCKNIDLELVIILSLQTWCVFVWLFVRSTCKLESFRARRKGWLCKAIPSRLPCFSGPFCKPRWTQGLSFCVVAWIVIGDTFEGGCIGMRSEK